MSAPRLLAALTLIIASAGWLALAFLAPLDPAERTAWQRILFVASGAAIVGGLTDWWAVRALFRPSRILGFRIPRTDVVVNSRVKIQRALGSLLADRVLPLQALEEGLDGLSVSEVIDRELLGEEGAARLDGLLAAVLRAIVRAIDTEALARLGSRAVADSTDGEQVLELVIAGAREIVARGDDARLFDLLLTEIAGITRGPVAREVFAEVIERTRESYSREGVLKAVAARLAPGTGAVADTIAEELARRLEALHAPDDPERLAVLEWARGRLNTLARSPEERAPLAATLDGWLDADRLTQRAIPMLRSLRRRILDPRTGRAEAVAQQGTRAIESWWRSRMESPQFRERLDQWVGTRARSWLTNHHGQLGSTVEATLSEMSDREMVTTVRSRVDEDLQWIRVSGTVVGFVVGLLVGALLEWVHQA